MTGFTLLGGDFFAREDAFAEQMTVWRDPDAKKSKKTGQVTFVPTVTTGKAVLAGVSGSVL